MNWDVVALTTLIVLYIILGVATTRVVHYLNAYNSNPLVLVGWPFVWIYGFVTGKVSISDIKKSFEFFYK